MARCIDRITKVIHQPETPGGQLCTTDTLQQPADRSDAAEQAATRLLTQMATKAALPSEGGGGNTITLPEVNKTFLCTSYSYRNKHLVP